MKKPLLLLSFLALIVSCTKAPVIMQPSQPEGYAELYSAYKAGRKYTGITTDATYTTVTFDDKSQARLTCAVYDCTDSTPWVAATDSDNQWMLSGKTIGIWYIESVKDEEAVPIYIYYKDNELHVLLSNGGHFAIKYCDPDMMGAIPIFYVNTANGAQINSKETYVDGTLRITDKDHKYMEDTEFTAPMKIRGRGNSTWWLPKKPYKIKLNSKARLFDMSTDKEWCLLANYTDKSLIRNLTAMEISRICELQWTPKMISCEVYLNGKYQGVYNFSEHKKVSGERVMIDVDGGDVLLEIDEDQNETVNWVSELGTPFMFSDPEAPSAELENKVKQHIVNLETALKAKDFTKVDELLDRESFINAYIVQELTMNVDGNFRKSSFLTLPKDGKLNYYFVWDFDLSLGNADYYGDPPGNGPTGWWVRDYGSKGYKQTWFWYLFQDPEFVTALKQRWNEVYPKLQEVDKYIDKQYKIIGDEAIERNFSIWSFTDNQWWNASRRITTYSAELEHLHDFYAKRLAWLNSSINAL